MKRRHRAWMGIMGPALVMGATEPTVELAPFLVEAWHFDVMGTSIPADVARIDRETIRASGATSVPEVLSRLAGIRFSGYTAAGTEGQLAMRGFGDNSGLRVLVLVDGQVYNPPDMSGINWQGIEVSELETVEVIRGGQGVLYGNHAVSGVIKLETRDAGEELEGTVLGEAGSYGTVRGSLGIGRAIGGASVRAGGSVHETEGFRDNSASEAQSLYMAWKAGASRAGVWRGRVQLDHFDMQFPGPLSFGQLMEDPRQSTASGEEESETDSILATINGKGEMPHGDWELHSGYLNRDRDWNLDGSFSENQHHRWTLTPRVKLSGDQSFMILGSDLSLDWLKTREFPASNRETVRAEADLDRTTIGGYLFAGVEATNSLEISGGIRRERAMTDNRYIRYKEEQLLPELETNRGTIPNPEYRNPPEADPDLSFEGPIDKSGWAAELSVVAELREGLNAWAGWDRVYRYPSLDETASYQGYPLSDPLNAGLNPESGNNWEAGIKFFRTRWHFGLTGFHMRLANEIAYDDTKRLNVNLGTTERTGVELEGAWNLRNCGISGRLSLVDARFAGSTDGLGSKKLPLVPEFESTIAVWFSLTESVRFRYNLQHVSSRFQGNDNLNTMRKLPEYTLSDVTIEWRPNGRFSLTVAATNLFDKRHAVTAYSGGFYPGSGRRFSISAHQSF